MSTADASAHRLPGLDGLRAISIALVIGYHFHLAGGSQGWISSFFSNGVFGVDVFFTISGLLITWLLLREEAAHGTISLPQFYARRAVRILPPALGFLLVILLISVLNGSMKWKPWLSAVFFFRNLVMDDRFASGAVDTSHFWSLSIEEQFYMIWPLVFLLLRPWTRAPVLLALFMAAPVWRELNLHAFHATRVNLVRIDMHCDGLLAGCLLACAMEDRYARKLLSHPLFRSDLTALASLLVIVASFTAHANALPGIIRIAYPSIRAACVALFVHRVIRRTARTPSLLDWLLNLGAAGLIGRLSYSLYLWQQPFCMPTGSFRTRSNVINVLAACACTAASFVLIERPAQLLRRKLGSRTAGLSRPKELSATERAVTPSPAGSGGA